MAKKQYEFRKIVKHCLVCSKVLELRSTRDITRKKFCSHNCRMRYTQKNSPELRNNLRLGRTPESRKKAGRTMSAGMAIGEIPKPPRPSMAAMKALGKRRRGANNPRWITDRSKLKSARKDKNCSVRSSYENNQWRKAVFSKDDYVCQHCYERGGKLEAHHILSYAKHPKLRYNVKNGMTLCVKCHKDFHKKMRGLIRANSASLA